MNVSLNGLRKKWDWNRSPQGQETLLLSKGSSLEKSKPRIVVLQVGHVAEETLHFLQRGLMNAFPKTEVDIIETVMNVPGEAYDSSRRQYHSTYILDKLSDFARRIQSERVLGVTEVDLYVTRLNFVFGEAQCPGNVAVISLFRLKPEFDGVHADDKLFLERVLKEAIHEIGHTFGLRHCPRPSCVMFFSNVIGDTDRKDARFCDNCHLQVRKTLEK